jgi:hypothetical protein
MLSAEIEVDLAVAPSAHTQHYFVTIDDTDPNIDEEAAGLDPAISEPQSMTRFFTLPTVIARINPKRGDPIVNFAKSINLTSDQYVEAVHQMKCRKEEVAMAKERIREERVESKKRKATEWEEAAQRRALEQEESQDSKNQRAAERAESQAHKAAKREVKAATKATVKAATKATEKARRAAEKHQFTQSRNLQSTQRAHRWQTNRDIGAVGAPQDCSDFAFTASQFSSFPQVHALQFPPSFPLSSSHLPTSSTHVGGHYFYNTPSPLFPTMPPTQHPFSQFDIPIQSTLPTMQFIPFF